MSHRPRPVPLSRRRGYFLFWGMLVVALLAVSIYLQQTRELLSLVRTQRQLLQELRRTDLFARRDPVSAVDSLQSRQPPDSSGDPLAMPDDPTEGSSPSPDSTKEQ